MNEFYQRVPKTLVENLKYRIQIRERCEADADFRQGIMAACKRDVLFWMNVFGWLYEPRPMLGPDGKKLPMVIPFITWPHQDPVILEIKENLGLKDIGMEKARGEGASWLSVMLAEHEWLYEPMSAIGLVSRNEEAVDSADDPDTLMWKIAWSLTKLPPWMTPNYTRKLTDHTLKNHDNGSTISGYAATGDVASGGRKKWFLMDELAKFPRGPDVEAMASTQHVTECRLIVSTPKGADGAYYDFMHEPSNMVRLVLDWKGNPTRNRGLYTFVEGVPVACDPENNPLPPDYDPPSREVLDMFSRLRRKGFKLEGKVRSSWYDYQCDRPGATSQNIAQELDRDYGGSMYRVFGSEFFEKAESTVVVPRTRGTLDIHPEKVTAEFNRNDHGPVLLWCPLNARAEPPKHRYVVGADVCTGVGGEYTSNSSIEVFDEVTMEQVLEYVSNTIPPADWADIAVAIAKWFHGAYLAWEHNGPGTAFTQRVLDLNYPNVYRRTIKYKTSEKRTKAVGWWTSKETKTTMFSELHRSVKTGQLVLRSDMLLKECGQYVVLNGKIEHAQAANTQDDSGKGEAHGDRVIGAGVALQALRDQSSGVPREVESETDRDPPPYTMAARMQEYEESLQQDDDGWDSRTSYDLAHPGMFSVEAEDW